MYTVIKPFIDLQDNCFPYKEGDVFPRNGLKVTKTRLNELSGKKNKLGTPLIKELAEIEEE